ncbi:DUF806 family protein [Leuconostoc falkenbergense]|uniref:DUF806 family protein n=1 Tax=Leuconostoc falkenbergense TaxID=2766470 RepID=UPI00166A1237|nr:DUF806 family protein [Leuconostoc falkenbergense]
MTILMQARALLESLTSGWVDVVYADAIPEEDKDKVDQTVILVRPAYDQLEDYGSDSFTTITRHLNIQIFYKVGNELDYDDLEVKLYKALQKNGYRVDEIKGRLIDIDTSQDYQTFIVTINKTV